MSDEKDEEKAKKAGGDGEGDVAEDEKSTDDEASSAKADADALARRVAALGEDDAEEKRAREEERKLAERRAAKKGGKKKVGLEVAASKKLAKIGTRAEPRRSVAVAADADPLIERTAKLSEWAKQNQKTVQIVGLAIALSLLGISGWLYYEGKRETDASVLLAKAVADERARIGEPPKDDEESDGTPYFKDHAARRAAALDKYRAVQKQFSGTGAAILSRLAEGSILLDMREAKNALAAYNDVKNSPLAQADQEVRGRAIEGIGFANELLAQSEPAESAKYLDAALAAYKELENTVDVKGFKEMALYHQARVHEDKGDKNKAKELLVTLKERMNKPEEGPSSGIPMGPPFPYLNEVAMDRLREIDPSSAPKPSGAAPGGNRQLSPAQIKKMIEDAQKKGAAGGGHGH